MSSQEISLVRYYLERNILLVAFIFQNRLNTKTYSHNLTPIELHFLIIESVASFCHNYFF